VSGCAGGSCGDQSGTVPARSGGQLQPGEDVARSQKTGVTPCTGYSPLSNGAPIEAGLVGSILMPTWSFLPLAGGSLIGAAWASLMQTSPFLPLNSGGLIEAMAAHE